MRRYKYSAAEKWAASVAVIDEYLGVLWQRSELLVTDSQAAVAVQQVLRENVPEKDALAGLAAVAIVRLMRAQKAVERAYE